MKHHCGVDVGVDALARTSITNLYILAKAEMFDVRGW